MDRKKIFFLNQSAVVPRVLPFTLFVTFIGAEEFIRFTASRGCFEIPYYWFLYLYPLKAVAIGSLLFYYRKNYVEIEWRKLANFRALSISIAAGIMVFVLWINMTWPWAVIGSPFGFNPTAVENDFTRAILVIFRLAGASIVVPIMEELFWRSWLLRYIISSDFQTVPLGMFTYSSFIIGTVMFGLEHNLWLAGMIAGAVYTLLLYQSKSLAQCIVAHSLTNLLLGLYVLHTGKWEFW